MNHGYILPKSQEINQIILAEVLAYGLEGTHEEKARALYGLLTAIEFKIEKGIR